jgi:hypothetical protein
MIKIYTIFFCIVLLGCASNLESDYYNHVIIEESKTIIKNKDTVSWWYDSNSKEAKYYLTWNEWQKNLVEEQPNTVCDWGILFIPTIIFRTSDKKAVKIAMKHFKEQGKNDDDIGMVDVIVDGYYGNILGLTFVCKRVAGVVITKENLKELEDTYKNDKFIKDRYTENNDK